MEFLKDILGDELYSQVAQKLEGNENVRIANVAGGAYVPKAKYDEERESTRNYKSQISDLNKQIEALKTAAAGSESLQAQIAEMQRQMQQKEQEMADARIRYSVLDAIRGAKARNADVVLKSIDLGKVSEANGQLFGLNEQLEALKASDAYLFEDAAAPRGGVEPNSGDAAGAGANFSINQAIRHAAGF